MYTTDQFEGMIAGTITIKGHNNDAINTYFARKSRWGSCGRTSHGRSPRSSRLRTLTANFKR